MKIERRFAVTAVLSAFLAIGPSNLWALSSREGPGEDLPSGAAAEGALREKAAAKLRAAGLSPEEASLRTDRLSRAEAWHVVHEAPEVRHGGDALVTVLVIVAIVAVVWFIVDHHHGHAHL